ncbi:MAG: HAMP domain-containing protein, partial [Microbacterium sp.]
MRLLPRTLTSRLVVTAVALVAVVGILVGLSATLVMRNILSDRLDEQVSDAARRSTPQFERAGGPSIPDGIPVPPGNIGGGVQFRPPQSVGTLYVVVPVGGSSAGSSGGIVTEDSTYATLSADSLAELAGLSPSRSAHAIEVGGRGYHVIVTQVSTTQLLVVGLPTDDIDNTLESLVTTFALLTLIGIGIAIIAGTGLVRHQLRPLHEVAEAAREVTNQDLSSGDTTITTRVPAELADTTTEVGQVGAALNTLLDHVDTALGARHRSEQQVRQFVADASHELRTPLATITG